MTYRTKSKFHQRLIACIAIAAGAAVFSAAGARAADLPSRVEAPAPAPIAAPPVFTWIGFYVGLNAGYGWGDEKVGFFIPGTGNFPNVGTLNRSGFVGGAQAGYNWQYGSVVLGIETDIQYSGMRDRLGPVTLPGGIVATATGRTNWYGTLRPRIGYAFGNTLIFATGGLAYGNNRATLAAVDGAGNNFLIANNSTRVGWTLGGGIEHAFNNNWSVKLEYGYVHLGSKRASAPVLNAALVPTGQTATTTFTNNFHTVRAGLNYRF